MSNEIRWDTDPSTRHLQCVQFHPKAIVRIRQLTPVEDDNVPSLPISEAPTHDDVIAHLRKNHWDGRDATYRWVIGDTQQSQWAAGTIVFSADDSVLLQFFAFDHLPAHLQEVSMGFCQLAEQVAKNLPRNVERTVALRKLLEAKDAAKLVK